LGNRGRLSFLVTMPNAEHTYHSEKMKRCVADLEAKGEDPGKAHRICYASLGAEANKVKKQKNDEPCEYCDSLKDFNVLAKNAPQKYTLGIVYAPDELDTDEEFADAAEIEKACWDYMRTIQGRGTTAKALFTIIEKIKEASANGDEVQLDITELDESVEKLGVRAMHAIDLDDAEVVECYIAPADFELNGEKVTKGSWLAGIIWPEEAFNKIQSGEWTGYSMGGRAMKIKVAE
jgi:hypothetical protein